MNFQLSQGQRQEVKLDQTATLQQAQAQQLKLTLKLAAACEQLFQEGPDAPKIVLDKVVGETLEAIPSPSVRASLSLALSDPGLRERLCEECDSLSVPDVARVRRVVTDFYFDLSRGEAQFSGLEGQGIITERISKAWYNLAFKFEPDPERKNSDSLESQVHQDRTLLQELAEAARSKGDDTDFSSLIDQIREKQVAVNVRNEWIGAVKNHTDCLVAALLVRDDEGQPILGNFLRELAIMRKMRFIIADRTMARFSARVGQISKNETASGFSRATTNFVGEYVLCAMGVLDPSIFTLRKGTIEEEQANRARKDLAEIGINYDRTCEHYKLQPSGTIFWNRWNVVGQKPSAVTDELVRNFIGSTVGEDQDEILRAGNYDEFFKRIKAIELGSRGKGALLSRAVREEQLREAFVDFIASPALTECLIKLARDKWYPKLDIFYRSSQNYQEKDRRPDSPPESAAI
ncbi:MAG: hypothetical protein KDD70_11125 [Bdellovibrionales bacterium]|nr:hypothetical protein [Bdellovibrionales bacterium]